MENENNNPRTPAPGVIDIIKPETLVNIAMSSGYYKRIQNALAFMIAGKSADELNEAHQQISLQDITHEWIHHYETLLILAKEFETIARNEGFVVQVSQSEAAEMLKDSL
ncbi:MAG: hypothetical protein EBR30_02440 [Cytophagia bacterium]|jgi:hypothetical protein|nr:hypothetical protein [Cytophagia bacterium]